MQKFKAFRKKNNLTQEEVAAYFGVKQSFISQIENNIRSIPESFISKFSAINLKYQSVMKIVHENVHKI